MLISPPFRLDVLHVRVLALGDRRHDLADVDAVLDDGVARLVVLQSQLVADRDVALRDDADVLVVFHDPAGQLLAGLDPLDHDDAYAVALLVHYEMDHCGTPWCKRMKSTAPTPHGSRFAICFCDA